MGIMSWPTVWESSTWRVFRAPSSVRTFRMRCLFLYSIRSWNHNLSAVTLFGWRDVNIQELTRKFTKCLISNCQRIFYRQESTAHSQDWFRTYTMWNTSWQTADEVLKNRPSQTTDHIFSFFSLFFLNHFFTLQTPSNPPFAGQLVLSETELCLYH